MRLLVLQQKMKIWNKMQKKNFITKIVILSLEMILVFGSNETSGILIDKNSSESFSCSKHDLANKIQSKVMNFLQNYKKKQ